MRPRRHEPNTPPSAGSPYDALTEDRREATPSSGDSSDALGLSPRQGEVLRWVAEGKRDGEIAVILGLSPRTVSHHLERIYRKLNVETRTAAAMAMHTGAQTK